MWVTIGSELTDSAVERINNQKVSCVNGKHWDTHVRLESAAWHPEEILISLCPPVIDHFRPRPED